MPALLVCIMLIGSTTAFAAASEPAVTEGNPLAGDPIAPAGAGRGELFPTEVLTANDGDARQIVKTYVLTAEQDPADIPRGSFERDGWEYTLTDITQQRSTGTERNDHTESIQLETESNDLNAIIAQLAPTLEYTSEDGFCGLLSLNLASIKCEEAGRKNSSYTVTATREYPHLSANDLSLVPKSITENGRTLELNDVAWESQQTNTVDYEEIPETYRAVVTYTGTAYSSKVIGYITTAEYIGEVSRTVDGDIAYTAYFTGTEIAPPTPEPTAPSEPVEKPQTEIPILPIALTLAILALLAGAGAYYHLLHNVKIYIMGENGRSLAAKDKISAKQMTIDLTPLASHDEARCFQLEIERQTAKHLSGKTVEVVFGPAKLAHVIAYEGSIYRIEVDFQTATIEAIY